MKPEHTAARDSDSFAVSERLAFARQLEGAEWDQAVIYRDKLDDVSDSATAELSSARQQLHAHVARRLAELRLLTRAPLTAGAKGPEKLARVRELADADSAWGVLGTHYEEVLDLPELPARLRKDLFGSMELLLAMAGQLGRDATSSEPRHGTGPASSGPTTSGPGSRPLRLPWSLSLVTFLPALRPLRPPQLSWLRALFTDLRPQQRHVGVDDREHAWFKDLKLQSARALLQEGSAPMCRAFLKNGAPHSCRGPLWEAALCLPPALRDEDVEAFGSLCSTAAERSTLLDVCVLADVDAIANSEHLFLFEEMLRAVALALSRDWQLPSHTSVELHPDVDAVCSGAGCPDLGGAPADRSLLPPPVVLVPGAGTVQLAGPLCYMFTHPARVYRLFRSMYARYWCKLRSLSPLGGAAAALPSLVKAYECVLQELDPEVVSHVHRLGVPVAALSVHWITSAFSGHLAMEEVLLLWDRILGLDSLFPLPLLAVAIVCFRRQVILTCAGGDEVLEAMSDVSQLQAVPLLQAVLFSG